MKPAFPLLTSLVALLAAGCVATKQYVPLPDQSRAVDDPSKGRIYVMRPAMAGTAVSIAVSEDGRPIGVTGSRGYLCWERAPGDTIVSSTSEGVSELPLTVNAGQTYYIFQHLRMGWITARSELELLDQTEGQKVLKKCKPPKVELKADQSISQ